MSRCSRSRLTRSTQRFRRLRQACHGGDALRRAGVGDRREDARLGSLRVRGGDTEFERLRPYSRGDEMRHVDWRASARRDDLVVRQYQAESNQNVVFALDLGRAMRGESGSVTSHAPSASATALAIATGVLMLLPSPMPFAPRGVNGEGDSMKP